VSGGVWGLDNGYCIMFGGSAAAAARLQPYMQALAPTPTTGWLHTGPVGSGHYTKMVHNGIEYAMMQAFAEGFALMKDKPGFNLDMAKIAELWQHGSVVRSWLLDLTADFLAKDQTLEAIEPFVSDSGEGRWTALASIEQGIPTPVMTLALMSRFDSQGRADYGNKMLAKMRQGFGGHAVKEG
jgi:6-phosphogluconate dehydrogenase